MLNSTQNAPEHISAGLYRFGFQPDNGRRKAFSQWRLDVGKPLEYYADVYPDNFIELYERPRNGKHIASRFSGRADSEIDLIRLLYQINFIAKTEFEEARLQLAELMPPARVCVGTTGGEIIKTAWPADFRRNPEEEPPF